MAVSMYHTVYIKKDGYLKDTKSKNIYLRKRFSKIYARQFPLQMKKVYFNPYIYDKSMKN